MIVIYRPGPGRDLAPIPAHSRPRMDSEVRALAGLPSSIEGQDVDLFGTNEDYIKATFRPKSAFPPLICPSTPQPHTHSLPAYTASITHPSITHCASYRAPHCFVMNRDCACNISVIYTMYACIVLILLLTYSAVKNNIEKRP